MKKYYSELHVEYESLKEMCANNPKFFLESLRTLKTEKPQIPKLYFLLLEAYGLLKLSNMKHAVKILVNVLNKAALQEEYFVMMQCNLLLSVCYMDDPTKVLACLENAESNARSAKNPVLLAKSLMAKGDFLSEQNRTSEAEELFRLVAEIIEDSDETKLKICNALSLAKVCCAHRDYESTANYLQIAYNWSIKTTDYEQIIQVCNRMAIFYTERQMYPQAEKVLQDIISICDNKGFPLCRIQALFSLAVLNIGCGRAKAALQYLDQSAEMAERIKFSPPGFKLDLYNNYAVVYGMMDCFEEALANIESAMSIAQKLNNLNALLDIKINAAKIYLKCRSWDNAKELLFSCIKDSKKSAQKSYLFNALNILADVYRRSREYPDCVKTLYKIIGLQTKQLQDHQMHKHQESVSLIQEDSPQIIDLSDKRQIHIIHAPMDSQDISFIGKSPAAKEVQSAALLAANHPNANVLICGESGTGKEVIAEIIHRNSIRRYHPYVPFNAAAISPSLSESELFGHTKGSFTGAVSSTKGYFITAGKGTLFIDEVTEMPIELQAKLLRAVESKKVIPVGSARESSYYCRIISSTNRNIKEMIQTNRFRLDLYHRINTIEIFIPPLRERLEDIPILVNHFLDVFCAELGKNRPRIHASFFEYLQEYSFPGNVRELKNIIERMLIMGQESNWDSAILQKICPISVGSPNAIGTREMDQKESIMNALINSAGSQKQAAKLLGMSESTLSRRIQKYDLGVYSGSKRRR